MSRGMDAGGPDPLHALLLRTRRRAGRSNTLPFWAFSPCPSPPTASQWHLLHVALSPPRATPSQDAGGAHYRPHRDTVGGSFMKDEGAALGHEAASARHKRK